MKQLLNLDLSHFYKSYELGIIIFIIIILIYPILIFTRKIFRIIFSKMTSIDNVKIQIIEKHYLYSKLSLVVAALYLMLCSEMLDTMRLVSGIFVLLKNKTVQIFITISILMMAITVINIGADIYRTNLARKKIPLVLYTQILKIIIITCASLIIMSTILGLSIPALFASLGAATAVFAFIFKDLFFSLISSLQVTYQDIIRVGDWIKLPKHGTEGEVEKITITIVVLKNPDGTRTIIPISVFLNDFIINCRLMFENNFKRIRHALNIHMDFVKICDQKMLDNIMNSPTLQKFIQENKTLFDVNLGISNLTLLRKYINFYLANNEDIHQKGFTCTSRLLEPGLTGLPIEIYAFAKRPEFMVFENIQSNIIEHILSVLPIFGLKSF
ncbi:MAG: mechanosensitive ion channel [Rickettsiales bacterium]|nr:MAG: mechanosensitive ion channel [Rickettsiales bacterium]